MRSRSRSAFCVWPARASPKYVSCSSNPTSPPRDDGAKWSRDGGRPKETTMQLTPYLNYKGDCAAAFKFYEKSLGGKIEMLQTHGETPMKDQVPAEWHKQVMHGQINIGGAVLFGADSPPDQYEKPQA